MRLTSFSAPLHSGFFYACYESRKYPVFFRCLDGFYSPEHFQQLPQLMASHVYVIDENGPIGAVVVHGWNRSARSCSVGIMLIDEVQGKGLCEKAMIEVGRILFEDKGIQKISVNFVEEDEKILHLVEKFGFKNEGVFERECFVGGKYKTTLSYAFFSEQWEALCRKT